VPILALPTADTYRQAGRPVACACAVPGPQPRPTPSKTGPPTTLRLPKPRRAAAAAAHLFYFFDACTVISLWRTAQLLCCTSAMLLSVSLYLVVRPSCLRDLIWVLCSTIHAPAPTLPTTPLLLLYPRPMPLPASPSSVIYALCRICPLSYLPSVLSALCPICPLSYLPSAPAPLCSCPPLLLPPTLHD
jgi:hypothetical protein